MGTTDRIVGACVASAFALLTACVLAGCPPTNPGLDGAADGTSDAADSAQDPDAFDAPPAVPQVRMDFAATDGFYAAPFPSEHRRLPSGLIDLSAFPNPRNIDFVRGLIGIAAGVDGAGTTTGIFFALTAAPDPAQLPDYHHSIDPASQVFLIGVDPSAPDRLRRYPVGVEFEDDGGPFGSRNMLSLLPLQGVPLRPRTLYAAVVMRGIWRANTTPAPIVPASLTMMLAGTRPDGMTAAAFASYQSAFDALRSASVDLASIAGLTVFRTAGPTEGLGNARRDILARPLPTPVTPLVRGEMFADYCVYHSTIRMPDYQAGTPPFSAEGGGWLLDPMGHLIFQRDEEANLVVTIPRRAMPAAGYPTNVFVRAGGGGDRPLVDRGVHAVAGGMEITPGSGPAMDLAAIGFAGVSVDGPLGGRRNTTGADEQFLVFNVGNLLGTRDTIRQSALELILLAHILETLTVDASDCPGAVTPGGVPARFDTSKLALMGHSTGATITPLAAAYEPLYRAVVLGGAGGSFIDNVIFKHRPVEVLPVAELLVRYTGTGRHLHEHDPILSLLQWGGEPADPPVYGPEIVREPVMGTPRHVLNLQGIVDHYLLPPISNATTLSIGLELAGTPLDVSTPELSVFAPLGTLVDLAGSRAIALPAQGNVMSGGGGVTSVVVQLREDGIEDGHEVMFQTEGPKHLYRCFLSSFAAGTPRVPSVAPIASPCD